MTVKFYYEGMYPSRNEIKREIRRRYSDEYTLVYYSCERVGDAKQTDMQSYHNVDTGSEYLVTAELSGGCQLSFEEDWRDWGIFQGR